MKGKVVDRPPHLGIGDHPAAVEGGITSPEGPLAGIEYIDHLAIEANQGVITHLILIPGMGGLESAQG